MKSAEERLLDDVRNRLGVIADEASYHAADCRDVGAVQPHELPSASPPHCIDELGVAHLLRAEHAEDRSATRAMGDGPSYAATWSYAGVLPLSCGPERSPVRLMTLWVVSATL